MIFVVGKPRLTRILQDDLWLRVGHSRSRALLGFDSHKKVVWAVLSQLRIRTETSPGRPVFPLDQTSGSLTA